MMAAHLYEYVISTCSSSVKIEGWEEAVSGESIEIIYMYDNLRSRTRTNDLRLWLRNWRVVTKLYGPTSSHSCGCYSYSDLLFRCVSPGNTYPPLDKTRSWLSFNPHSMRPQLLLLRNVQVYKGKSRQHIRWLRSEKVICSQGTF